MGVNYRNTRPLEKEESDLLTKRAKRAAMKEEFLELCITGKDVHWPTLAAKYGFKPQTARNYASIEKWYAEIEERRKQREDILDAKLTERTTMALDKLNEDFMTSEVAIRKRHATIARGLQVKAVARLKEFELKDFRPSEVIQLLKLGMEEERKAMGLPETYKGEAPVDATTTHFKPVVEQMGGHKKVQALGMKLLKAFQGLDVSDIEVAANDEGEEGEDENPQDPDGMVPREAQEIRTVDHEGADALPSETGISTAVPVQSIARPGKPVKVTRAK